MVENKSHVSPRRLLQTGVVGVLLALSPDQSAAAASVHTPSEHGAINQTSEQKKQMREVIELYRSETLAEAKKDGYIPDGDCITGEEIGIEDKGDMGYHAENEALKDTLDPMHPPVLVYATTEDQNATPIALEWEVDITSEEQTPPSLFGVEFGFMEGHRMGDGMGGEMMMPDHFHLHIPVVDNPYGEFAMTNPNVHCPTASNMDGMPGMDPNMPMS